MGCDAVRTAMRSHVSPLIYGPLHFYLVRRVWRKGPTSGGGIAKLEFCGEMFECALKKEKNDLFGFDKYFVNFFAIKNMIVRCIRAYFKRLII